MSYISAPPRVPSHPLFRIYLAMPYRQWLLATTALYSPVMVYRLAAPPSTMRHIRSAGDSITNQKAA